MFGKKAIIEVDENNVIKHEIIGGCFKFKYRSECYNFSALKNLHIDLKHKATSILLEGEEVGVKLINLPKVKKEILQDLIRDELLYHFDNLDSIVFTYTISKEDKSSLAVLVFCVNITKINFVQSCLKRSRRIKNIRPIQFCFLSFIKPRIIEKNYAVAFTYRDYIYFLYCINNRMLYNRVYEKTQHEMELKNLFQSFLENCSIISEDAINRIYFANCNHTFNNNVYNQISCINLGSIEEKLLLKSLYIKRR